jgi:hypothetical protein
MDVVSGVDRLPMLGEIVFARVHESSLQKNGYRTRGRVSTRVASRGVRVEADPGAKNE